MTEPEPTEIHGLMDKRLASPRALERDGRMVRVAAYRPREDLVLKYLWLKEFRSYWDVVLDNGEQLTIYRDQLKSRWYLSDE